jgi:hypothetical protein
MELTEQQFVAAVRRYFGLSEAVRLAEQCGATREAQRYGEMLRHMSGGDPAKVHEAEQAARAARPELWAGLYVNTEKVGA